MVGMGRTEFQPWRAFVAALLIGLAASHGTGASAVIHTMFACETQVLESACEEGQVISFVRANYGRTSLSVCNDDGREDWDFNCVNASSSDLMREKCDGRRKCSVVASNYIFGDPCPGTEKYLEVVFNCIPDPNPPTTVAILLTRPDVITDTTTDAATDTTEDTSTPLATTTTHQPDTTTTTTTTKVVVTNNAAILYCNTKDLRRLDLDSNVETVLARNLNRSVVVDFDYGRNVFVWTDSSLKAIFSSSLSGDGDHVTLAANVTSYGVAVDWVLGHVYWTDSSNDVIDVVTLDGKMRKTLFTDLLDEPRGIVLDPAEGYLYWSDWGDNPKIEKAGMDGSARRVIVSMGLKWPNGLAIDLTERRLYWIEAFHENLCTSNLDGRDVKKIIAHSSFLKLPFSIDVFQDWVYWTEWTSNRENIFKANKVTGGDITRVLDGETTLMGIKIYHSAKQPNVSSTCNEDNGGCSHLCLPSPSSSYNSTCACPNGLERTPDGLNCTAAPAVHAVLLYCNRHNIKKYDLSNGSDVVLVDLQQRATVMDFHYEKKMIVWTDTDQKKVFSALLTEDGARPVRQTVADSCTSYGVAVDWLQDLIYFTDTLNNKIVVASLDGSRKRALFTRDIDEPRAIVLDPAEGWMYWTDWGEVPKIERAGMDGTHRRVIVSQNIRWPNGLAIDQPARRLYWVDGKLNILCVADLEGTNRKTLISSTSLMKHPFSLDLLGEWLFWVEWSSGKESVFKARKEDGSRSAKVFDGERSLMGLKVYDQSRQPTGPNVCGDDNGGCSHLCLPAPSTDGPTTNFTCACPANYYLQPDGLNCSTALAPTPDRMDLANTTGGSLPFLLCANVDNIRVIDLRSYEDNDLITDLTRATAIDYFYENRTVVWTDIREDRICSAPLSSGGLVTEVVSDCSHPDGVAVDWIHGNLYWTDKGKDAIGVARLGGGMQKTLFKNDLDEPRAIAVDPFRGYMFWTDWGRVPKIERAGMDGTDRRVIVSRGVQWPNGVTVDLALRKIYWADAKTHEICSANYDGTGKKVILMSFSVLKQPFSIDVVQNEMYWVEWRSGEECVYKADKLTGRNVTKVVDGRRWKNLMGIKVFHVSKQPAGTNKCGLNNGRCSHLCLPSPTSFSCACPDNLTLAYNGRDCLTALETTTIQVRTDPPPTTPSSPRNWTGEGEAGVLLYANKKDIRALDLYTKEDRQLAADMTKASAVDFHYAKKLLVWTDADKKQIYSAPLWSSSPVTTLVPSNATANGVAVDWIHDLIFWTDNVLNSVNVMTLDGRMTKTLFKGGEVEQPRTIVLHPRLGWIFWTDWGRKPKIERAGMDGSNRQTIVETKVDWTHALAIDVYVNKLYWANSDSKQILSVNLDGTGSKVLLTSPSLLHLPFSMDVLKEHLYWTEFLPFHEKIYKINKFSGMNPVSVYDGRSWTSLMSIKLYHKVKQPTGVGRCDGNRCSHFCLPRPQLPSASTNYSCECPDGMELASDLATCYDEGAVVIPIVPIAKDGNSSQIVQEKSEGQEGTPVGIIIGVIAAVAIVVLAGVFVYYRHFLRRNLGNMIFNNPLYRKHTEDFSIDKHSSSSSSARKSLVPLTATELE